MTLKSMHVVMTPTSIASTGTGNSSSINSDGSVNFASCATLSLNGVFTSSYDNYMVVMRSVGSLDDQNIWFRMRSSGTDNTTANSYTRQALIANGSSIIAARASADFGVFASNDDSERSGSTAYLFGPYLAQPTAHRLVSAQGYLSATVTDAATTHNQSTAYDGITFYNSSANFTGLVTVYGFNQ